MEHIIYNYLPKGEKNAVSKKELCEVFHISTRELRNQIEAERKDGAVILSRSDSHGGFFRAENEEELKHFVNSMYSRVKNIKDAAKSARKCLLERKDTSIKWDY